MHQVRFVSNFKVVLSKDVPLKNSDVVLLASKEYEVKVQSILGGLWDCLIEVDGSVYPVELYAVTVMDPYRGGQNA